MPFHQPGRVRYYTFDSLTDAGLVHAVVTRRGGTSPSPWDSLNLGGTVGDDPARVAENRRLAVEAVGRSPASVYDVWQVHSADVARATAPRPADIDHLRADVIITDRPEVTLLMRFADCVPILLYDPVHQAVSLAHAGWLGTVRKAAAAAVQALHDAFGSRPEDLVAAVGPSIGAHHYEVGPEVAGQVRDVFGEQAPALLPQVGSAVQFDLWAANRLVLEQAGVRQIEVAGLCTACSLNDWYSHRAEAGRTGRFGVVAAIPD